MTRDLSNADLIAYFLHAPVDELRAQLTWLDDLLVARARLEQAGVVPMEGRLHTGIATSTPGDTVVFEAPEGDVPSGPAQAARPPRAPRRRRRRTQADAGAAAGPQRAMIEESPDTATPTDEVTDDPGLPTEEIGS